MAERNNHNFGNQYFDNKILAKQYYAYRTDEPTFTPVSDSGNTFTITKSNASDSSGILVITPTGMDPHIAGKIFDCTFSKPFSSTPIVFIQYLDTDSSVESLYTVSETDGTGWALYCSAALTADTAYTIGYFVVGT